MKRLSILFVFFFLLAATDLRAQCDAVPCYLTVNATITEDSTQAFRVPVDIVVTSVSASPEGFNVFADGVMVAGSPFTYDRSGTTTFQIFLPGAMDMHQIFIHDISDVSCTAIIPIETPYKVGHGSIDKNMIAFQETSSRPPEEHELTDVRSLVLYPNPVTTEDPAFSLTGIPASDFGRNGHIDIYTMQGRWVSSEEVYCDAQIPLRLKHTFSAGTYLVQLTTARNLYTGKLVIR